jgi:pimeloyl-ACP methyl ester carboxylesterase
MLHITETGTGPAVLFLHGLPSPAAEMAALGATLAGRRVLVATMPGYAGTAPAPGRQGVAAIEAMLLAALDARGIEELDVVGYSMGAYRAVSLALSGRVRVRSLVLLGPLVGLTEAEAEGMRGFATGLRAGMDFTGVLAKRFLSKAMAADPEAARSVEAWLRLAPASVLIEELEDLAAAPSLVARVTELRLPITLRVGAEDVATPSAHAEDIAARAEDAVLEIVPGVGHALMVEDFEETARSVARGLARAR